MKQINQLQLFGCALAIVISGCSGSSFSGGSNEKKNTGPSAPAAGTMALTATCDLAATGADIKVKSSMANMPIVLKGNMCPTGASISSIKQVIFVVDVSGSTRSTDPGNGVSCGRLTAAQQMAAALQQPGRTLSVIVFAGAAQMISQPTDITQSSSLLTYQNICSNGSTLLGGTNYDAAFSMVKQRLTPGSSGNLMFFISDGFPNLSNAGVANAQQAGLAAINQCRAIDPSLVTFGIFLNAEGGSSSDANTYMASLMGGPDKVAVVSNAQDLAAAAIKLLPSSTTKVVAVNATASLEAPGFPATPVAVDIDPTVTTDGARPAIGFVTKSFKLLGDPKVPVRHTLHVTMTDNTGQAHKQDYHLIYDASQ